MRAAPRAAAGPALCAERKSRRLLDRSHSAPNPQASVAITWPSTTAMLCAGHDMDSAGPLNRNRPKPSERKKDEALPPAERSVGDRANAPPIHARARYLWDHAPSRYGPCISPSADIGPLSPHRRPQRIVAPCSFPRSPPSRTSTTSPAPPTSRGRWSAANSRSARSRSSFGAARNSSGCGPACTAHLGAVSTALAWFIERGFVVALTRQGAGPTEYVLSGTSRLIFPAAAKPSRVSEGPAKGRARS